MRNGSTPSWTWADRPLHVVNLHLSTPVQRWRPRGTSPVPVPTGEQTVGRRAEIGSLVPRLRDRVGAGDAVVVAGDFNLTDQTPEYRALLGTGLLDAHREAGWGFGDTFPAGRRVRIAGRQLTIPFPLLRLDYVWHSRELATRQARVWSSSGGSDHLPVVADLVLRPHS